MGLGFLDPVGNLLGGIGSLVSSFNRPSIEKQLEVSKEMAKYQHDLNMDAWREQTAYNDPSRIMERLKIAKINPHSIAGNASVTGNATAAPATSVDTPDISKFQRKYDFSGLFQMAQGIHQIKQLNEQSSMNDSQKELNDSVQKLNDIKAENELLEGKNKQLRFQIDTWDLMKDKHFFQYDDQLKRYSVEQAEKNIAQTVADISRIQQSTTNEHALYDNWLKNGIHWSSSPLTRVMDYFGDTLNSSLGKLDTTLSKAVDTFVDDFLPNTSLGKSFTRWRYNKKREAYEKSFKSKFDYNPNVTPEYGQWYNNK